MHSIIILIALGAGTPSSADSNATVPLQELLRLYRVEQSSTDVSRPAPPVRATVQKCEMVGRLLQSALEVTAQMEVVVLAENEWVQVPLLEKDIRTSFVRLPALESATLSVVAGQLVLVTEKPGRYQFEIVFRKSTASAGTRSVDLRVSESAQSSLKLHFDESLFRVAQAPDGDGATLYPEQGRFTVNWTAVQQAQIQKRQRPPVESKVTQAVGEVISAMSGKTVTRIVYTLRLEGIRPFDLTLPLGEGLERVYLNGAPLAVATKGQSLHVEVTPARSGDDSAALEVVTSHQQAGYALSGTIDYQFPVTAWPCDELFVTLHLPLAFNYQWVGGSLSPGESTPEQTFSYELPTPGKTVALHQQLVDGLPSARVKYSVDLAQSYFR
jgi:hypothetical protein